MKRRKINHFYSIISVALVLFLLGFFGTTLLFTQQQVATQQEKIAMMIELKDNPDSAAMESLKAWLPTADFARQVNFVSKTEAADIMREQLGSEFISPDMPLPFYDAFSINLKSDRYSSDSIAAISARLQENEAVNDVYLDEGMLGDVSKFVEKLALFAFGVAALFIIVAITLIHNTIRLNLYADRFLIRNMELVGASWGFISRPYIRRGMRNGVLSALIALVALGAIWFFAQTEVPELNDLLKMPLFWSATLGLIALGLVISWLSTFYVVNKYLKMRIDDLY